MLDLAKVLLTRRRHRDASMLLEISKRAEGLKLKLKQAKLTKKDMFNLIQQSVYLCVCMLVTSAWFHYVVNHLMQCVD